MRGAGPGRPGGSAGIGAAWCPARHGADYAPHTRERSWSGRAARADGAAADPAYRRRMLTPKVTPLGLAPTAHPGGRPAPAALGTPRAAQR